MGKVCRADSGAWQGRKNHLSCPCKALFVHSIALPCKQYQSGCPLPFIKPASRETWNNFRIQLHQQAGHSVRADNQHTAVPGRWDVRNSCLPHIGIAPCSGSPPDAGFRFLAPCNDPRSPQTSVTADTDLDHLRQAVVLLVYRHCRPDGIA